MQGVGIVAAFLTGLAGSLHCVGVCSGIAVSLMTWTTPAGHSRAVRTMLLHTGRVLAYVVAGTAVGLGGAVFAELLRFAGAIVLLRWMAAFVMLWTGLSIANILPSPNFADHRLRAFQGRVFGERRLFPTPRIIRSPLLVGLGWGFMPCGMVYLALFNASLTGSAIHGGAYMAAFAFGALPALGAASFGSAGLAGYGRDRGMGHRHRRLLGFGIAGLAPLSMLVQTPDFFGALCGGS